MAYFAGEMERRGNLPAATMARSMIQAYGDLPLTEAFLPEFLRAGEQRILSDFFGREINVPPPPDELLLALRKASQIGWIHATPHYLPPISLNIDSKIPNWTQRPGQGSPEGVGFWEDIKNGRLDPSAQTIGGGWMIVDETPKPEYNEGRQMYENDPFAPLLTQLREEQHITVTGATEHIPNGSRYGISYEELVGRVYLEIGNMMGVDSVGLDTWVRSLFAIEFNILNSIHNPHFGKNSTTAEWLIDTWQEDSGEPSRLCAGALDITYFPHQDQYGRTDILGFRPIIEFK